MTWQDWFTFIGTIVGILSFILTIVTLILTGTVKKALRNKRKQELYNRDYDKNKKILNDLDLKNIDQLTFEDIKTLRILLYNLDYYNLDFSLREKNKIKATIKYCNYIYTNFKYTNSNDISFKQKKKCIKYLTNINAFYQRRI